MQQEAIRLISEDEYLEVERALMYTCQSCKSTLTAVTRP
jgi:hypothetical protein